MSRVITIISFFLLFIFQLIINRFLLLDDSQSFLLKFIFTFLFLLNFFLIFILKKNFSQLQIFLLIFVILLSVSVSYIFKPNLEKFFQYSKIHFIPKKIVNLKNKLLKNNFDHKSIIGEDIKISEIQNNLKIKFKLLFFLDNHKSGLLIKDKNLSVKYLGDRKDSRAHFILDNNKTKLVPFSNAFSNRNVIYLNEYDKNFDLINQKWKKTYHFDNHQWFQYFQGKLIVPGSEYKFHPLNKLELDISESNFKKCKGKIRMDTIELIDINNGKHLKTINILEKIFNINQFDDKKLFIDCLDPTHVSNIEVIDNVKKASHFPKGKVGDLLISLREMNSLILLDKDTFEVKWYLFDKTKKQFSTLMTDDGYILILDNMSKSALNGTTRIISFDVKNNKIHSSYEATGNKILDIKYRGKMQIYEDSLMLSDSLNGKLRQLKCSNISKLENCNELKTVIDFKKQFYLAEFYK